jgi:hypothetical protein
MWRPWNEGTHRPGVILISCNIHSFRSKLQIWTGQKVWSVKERNYGMSCHHGAEPFLRSCQLCSYSRTSQHFMEPGGSSPRSHLYISIRLLQWEEKWNKERYGKKSSNRIAIRHYTSFIMSKEWIKTQWTQTGKFSKERFYLMFQFQTTQQ